MDNNISFKMTDELYEAAFRFRKSKLWRNIDESRAFAVRLYDGKIVFCSVMGMLGEMIALNLYLSEDDFNTFRYCAELKWNLSMPFEKYERVVSQRCIQCCFCNKDLLDDDELLNIKKYTKKQKITLRGKGSFPQFFKYNTGYFPRKLLEDEKEQQKYMACALRAACDYAEEFQNNNINMDEMLEKVSPVCGGEAVEIPLFEEKGGKYIIDYDNVINIDKVEWKYPEPAFLNEIAISKIKKSKNRSGVYIAGVIMLPEAVEDENGIDGKYPYVLILADGESGFIINVEPILNYEENAERLVDEMTFAMMEDEKYPKTIVVNNMRTYCLLKDFCNRTKIQIVYDEDSVEIDMILSNMFDSILGAAEFDEDMEDDEMSYFMDDINTIIDMLDELDEEEAEMMPKSMARQLLEIAENIEDVPQETIDMLRNILGKNR